MNSVWDVETAHARFWRRLLNENVDKMINDPELFLLKHMRYDNEMAKDYQKRFGEILAERGTSMYKLIAGAYGEQWDSEDDQKDPSHVKAVYQKGKAGGMSYKSALQAAAKTWKKGSKAASKKSSKAKAEPEVAEEAPKKKRRRRKPMPKVPAKAFKDIDSINIPKKM